MQKYLVSCTCSLETGLFGSTAKIQRVDAEKLFFYSASREFEIEKPYKLSCTKFKFGEVWVILCLSSHCGCVFGDYGW